MKWIVLVFSILTFLVGVRLGHVKQNERLNRSPAIIEDYPEIQKKWFVKY